MKCIYLDHHATTPLDQRVFMKMKAFFFEHFGNASSADHIFGWRAHEAIEEARLLVAKAINAHPSEIIFTSGATESINTALKGRRWPHIISSSIEHAATLSTLDFLEQHGQKITLLQPDNQGLISADNLRDQELPENSLVSLCFVNNEIGTISDIKNLCKEAKKRELFFHCDAAQALGRVPIDCQDLAIDMLSLSAHKVYGPKGVGALYVRRELLSTLCPLIHGGSQEGYKRAGTLNVPGIVGFGEAARLATENLDEHNKVIANMRDRLWEELSTLGNIHINGSVSNRVAGNLNLSLERVDGEELLLALSPYIALSTGSACSSKGAGQSRVLQALGVPSALRQASFRFGLGRNNTEEDIDIAANLFKKEVQKQRKKTRLNIIKTKS